MGLCLLWTSETSFTACNQSETVCGPGHRWPSAPLPGPPTIPVPISLQTLFICPLLPSQARCLACLPPTAYQARSHQSPLAKTPTFPILVSASSFPGIRNFTITLPLPSLPASARNCTEPITKLWCKWFTVKVYIGLGFHSVVFLSSARVVSD